MVELGRSVFLAPLVLVAVISYLSESSSPLAHRTVLFLLSENHIVEWLQVVCFVGGSMLAWKTARTLKRQGDDLASRFYLVMALGLLFGALEEVSWGQQIFKFTPPNAIEQINRQHELNLHNMPVFFNLFEMLRVGVGVVGLAAVMLPARRAFHYVRAPGRLVSWFVLIIVMAGLDLMNQNLPPRNELFLWAQNLVEVMELLIAGSAFLYVHYNFRLATALSPERVKAWALETGVSATLPPN